MTRRPLAAVLLALVLAAGCTSTPPVTRSSTAPSTSVPASVGPAPDSDGLAAEKAAAGIRDFYVCSLSCQGKSARIAANSFAATE